MRDSRQAGAIHCSTLSQRREQPPWGRSRGERGREAGGCGRSVGGRKETQKEEAQGPRMLFFGIHF